MNKFTCPVCGYLELPRPPLDDMICPCCGTQFGYHDYTTDHAALRRKWMAAGAQWHSKVHSPPNGWNAQTQLLRAGFLLELGADTETQTDTHTAGHAWDMEVKVAASA